ncbi:MAG TPA: chorismate synthase [Longimicrobiales bacterium]|nr:chorismate synthase [Longimicrobiales bacterium]
MRFTYRTAGESHGQAIVAIVEGVPAGLSLDAERDIDPQLARRQGGYGRGARMKIERDRVEILSGVRLGETIGAPIALVVRNRDWESWSVAMAVEAPGEEGDEEALRRVHLPRPGHADLVGVLKYDRPDARDVLERASARETAMRVAAGAVAKRFLGALGARVDSHVVALGGVEAAPPNEWPEDINALSDASPVRVLDGEAEERIIAAIDRAGSTGDTLGGVFEVVARGLPVGLGSYAAADRRLDGRLAGALMSIQAMKGVEIGMGFAASARPGSAVHDEIEAAPDRRGTGGYRRLSNNAGGLEGGMTTGEPVVVRVAMKPLSTLMRPLRSVDLRTDRRADAIRERSDVVALAAAGVVGEAVVAAVLADAVLEKFGGDSMSEVRGNLAAYLDRLEERSSALRAAQRAAGGEGDRGYESGVDPAAQG